MANSKIKGITVEIGGDTTELTAALKGIDKEAKASSDELTEINRLLKLDPKNTELLAQKQKVLSEAIGTSKQKLDLLKKAEQEAAEQLKKGDIGEEQLRALQREVVYAENKLKKLEAQYAGTETAAKDAGKAVENSGAKSQEAAKDAQTLGKELDKLKGKYKETKDAAKDAGKELGAGFAAAGAAVVAATAEAMGYEDSLAAIQIQTGASAEEKNAYKRAMDAVYESGAGEDLDDIAGTMAIIAQQTHEADPTKLQELTESALLLKENFGFETAEQMRAVNMLTEKFGISSKEAYDLIVAGAQKGLNKNGDLLDVINEYSAHYAQMGYDAKSFFNSLANGTASGVFSVDNLGNAVKEFGIRTKDNTATTVEAYELLGLESDKMLAMFAAGGESAQEATALVLDALWDMEDQVVQNQAGVGLFGTMWEDLGKDAIRALTDTSDALGNVEGSMEAVREISLNATSRQWEQLGRTVQTELILPMGEKLLPVAKAFFSWCIENSDSLIPKIKTLAVLVGTVFVVNKVAKFTKSIKDLVSAYKALKAAATAANAAQSSNVWGLIATAIGIVVSAVYGLVSAYNDAEQAAREEREAALEAAREQSKAYEDLLTSMQEVSKVRREMSRAVDEEYDTYEDLWDELQKLVDADGNVLHTKELRVDFIRGELSDAIGEEIELIDGQIQHYGELAGAIDEALIKQRAFALLSENEAAYNEVTEQLPELQNAYETALADYYAWLELPGTIADTQAKRDDLEKNGRPDRDQYEQSGAGDLAYSAAVEAWIEALDLLDDEISELKDQYATSHAAADVTTTRAAYDAALAEIYYYDQLYAAYQSGDLTGMEQASEAMQYGLISTATGGSGASVYAQTADLMNVYSELLSFSKNEGSTITEEQLAEARELLWRSIFEAYAAYAAGEDIPYSVGALGTMLKQSGFGGNVDTAFAAVSEGKVATAEEFLTLLEQLAPYYAYAFESKSTAADPNVRHSSVTGTRFQQFMWGGGTADPVALSAQIGALISDAPLFSGKESISVEDEAAKISNDLLERIAQRVENMELTMVLEDGTLVAKTIHKTDNALGRVIAQGKRGSLSE